MVRKYRCAVVEAPERPVSVEMETVNSPDSALMKYLRKMSAEELKVYAGESAIPIGQATSENGIRNKILMYLKEQEP